MFRRRFHHDPFWWQQRGYSARQQSDNGRAMTMTAASLGAMVTSSLTRNKARTASLLGLWILGFLMMNYLPAPYEVTMEMRKEYNRIIAEEGRQDDVFAAEMALEDANIEYQKVNYWFWRFRGPSIRDPAQAKNRIRLDRQADLDKVMKIRVAAQRKAKKSIGVWSDEGVEEARGLFWRSYNDGKIFAQRQTFWDMVYTVFNSRSENVWGMLVKWIFIWVSNFTAGMVAAMFMFTCRVFWFLWQYSPNIVSGVAFFIVASFAALTTVSAYLVGVYGAAIGGVYAVSKMRNLAIENSRQNPNYLRGEQRRRNHQD